MIYEESFDFFFFLFAVPYGVFCSKSETCELWRLRNLIEVRGRGYDAVLVLRTLGYGKNDALAQEDAEVRVIRALLYSGFSKDYPAVISMSETEAETKSQGKLLAFFENKEYKDCISSVKPMGKLDKVKGEKVKKKPFDVTVNYYVLKNKIANMNFDSFGF